MVKARRQGLSIFVQILCAFLAVSTITSTALIASTYWFSTDSIEKHARSSIAQQLKTVHENFEQSYRVHVDRSLRWLKDSSLLDDYLFSSASESMVARKRLERLFQRTVDDSNQFESILFIDFDGRVKLNRKRRLRRGMRLAETDSEEPLDTVLGQAIERLFVQISRAPMLLSSGNMEWFMPPPEIQVEGPLFDNQGRLFALIGIGKLDHDTADFGGIVAIKVSMEPLLEELRELRFFGTRPLWMFGARGEQLQRPPEDESAFDPSPYLNVGFQRDAAVSQVAEGLVAYEDFSILPGRTFVRVAAAVPSAALHRDTVLAMKFFGLVLLASVGFVLVTSMYISRFLTRPIVKLADAALRFSRGDLSTRVNLRTTGEVQTLVESFNQMTNDLQKTMASRDASMQSLQGEVIERKRAEAELNRRAEELTQARVAAESADRAKGEFLATMSHEIRTPINGVLGMTELLLNTELNDKQARFTQTARRSILTLLDIINDILDFSKIEAGKLELAEEVFNLPEVVDHVAQMLGGSAHRKQIELVCVIPASTHPVYRGDAQRLRQVLTNLIGNAIKFTDRGQVVVRVRHLGSSEGADCLRIEVSDTGIGIPAAAQQRIFDAFSQADSSMSRRYGGTGLGLGISRQLVELMGGEIGVESEPGEGSRFWFTIRLTPVAGKVGDRTRRNDILAGRRILVVDDNATNREVLEGHLQSWGVHVDEAGDAVEALVKLKANVEPAARYDAVLLDFLMPGMTGVELGAVIRANATLGQTPLVLLGSVNEEDESPAIFDASLTKPVSQSELGNCLCGLLDGDAPEYQRGSARVRSRNQERFPARVLVAEDNAVNQEMVSEMVELLGGTPTVVNDGLEAIEAIEIGEFDIVLMDCQMPRMDGFEATVAVRELERARQGARTPIIALTANAFTSQRERCLECGMDDFMTKPFMLDDLRDVLRRWFRGSGEPWSGGSDDAESCSDISDADHDSNTGSSVLPATQSEPVSRTLTSLPPQRGSLDARALTNIRLLQRDGAEDVLKSYARLYFETSQGLLDRLRKAVASDDGPQINEFAHSLKGSSANIGALELAGLCNQLEQLTADGRTEDAHMLLTEIESRYEIACLLLAEACEEHAA